MLFPIKPSTLQKGQFLGGFVGIPGIASIIAVLLGAITFMVRSRSRWSYLICCGSALCEPHGGARLANRLGIVLNDNRRIANTLMIVAALLMMSAGFIFGGTVIYLTNHWEEVLPYLPWLA